MVGSRRYACWHDRKGLILGVGSVQSERSVDRRPLLAEGRHHAMSNSRLVSPSRNAKQSDRCTHPYMRA